MDKLRAIQYFNRAVEGGSFAAAARSLDVSTPAVAQLVATLERSLGTVLLHRTTRGLSLTADGARYYETSRRIATDLEDVEKRVGQRGPTPRGTLTVGMRQHVGQNCVMPRIPRFLARYPDVELVTRPVVTTQGIAEENIDLAIMVGWPPERELVVRHLAQTRLLVCASPGYWMSAGTPSDPEQLSDHHCLVPRNAEGLLLDRWTFERGGNRCTVDVHTRLISGDRRWLEEAACAGAGVVRFADLTIGRYLSSGLLVPVLTDWQVLEAPTIYAVYAPRQRKSKLVRVFLDFLGEVFAELENERARASSDTPVRAPQPEWWGRAHGRHSAYIARRRTSGAQRDR